MEKLKLGEIITLDGVKYAVDATSGYYLNNRDGCNNAFFLKHRLLKEELQMAALGYSNSGGFPFCNTLDDLTKFVEFLVALLTGDPSSYRATTLNHTLDLSPEKIKKEGRLGTFLLLNL